VSKDHQALKIALLGNPNAGKSTLFNALTGLNQKTGNYAGVTVDKLEGHYTHSSSGITKKVEVIDLPGTYSLFFKSLDEEVAVKTLLSDKEKIDVVLVVLDATNLKRNLLLATQAIDLGMKTVLVLNFMDEADLQGIRIDKDRLQQLLGVEIIGVDSRNKQGITALKDAVFRAEKPKAHFSDLNSQVTLKAQVLQQFLLKEGDKEEFVKWEEADKIERFKKIKYLMDVCVQTPATLKLKTFTAKVDRLLTHRVYGYLSFLLVLFVVFQFIFYVAEYPMNWIEQGFGALGDSVKEHMPAGMLTNLLTDGVLAGISGVVMFVPQIAFLFLFMAVLEDTGYMARAGFIMDRIMRRFGLNGRSVIPIISATACAVPSIMSTRTISNVKERLITIFVLPLVSCSARLPIYTLIISMMFPDKTVLGVFNLKGVVLMALYLLGFVFTLLTAWALQKLLKTKEASFFMMEMPVYRLPIWKNVALTVFNKVKVFVTDAGKIILSISVILWFLSVNGPGNRLNELQLSKEILEQKGLLSNDIEKHLETEKLEYSYIGYLGRGIEPVIRPLGYDWKIGIAILTSFAAREVFVGTMATIYGASDAEDEAGIREKLLNEKDANGNLRYTPAVCLSLVIFYVFAMQCMSTIATVKRETKSWKWPAVQFVYLTVLAYAGAWVVFVLFR
jgi:ferrous iron transport protein B